MGSSEPPLSDDAPCRSVPKVLQKHYLVTLVFKLGEARDAASNI
jgi:hypothetical protein